MKTDNLNNIIQEELDNILSEQFTNKLGIPVGYDPAEPFRPISQLVGPRYEPKPIKIEPITSLAPRVSEKGDIVVPGEAYIRNVAIDVPETTIKYTTEVDMGDEYCSDPPCMRAIGYEDIVPARTIYVPEDILAQFKDTGGNLEDLNIALWKSENVGKRRKARFDAAYSERVRSSEEMSDFEKMYADIRRNPEALWADALMPSGAPAGSVVAASGITKPGKLSKVSKGKGSPGGYKLGSAQAEELAQIQARISAQKARTGPRKAKAKRAAERAAWGKIAAAERWQSAAAKKASGPVTREERAIAKIKKVAAEMARRQAAEAKATSELGKSQRARAAEAAEAKATSELGKSQRARAAASDIFIEPAAPVGIEENLKTLQKVIKEEKYKYLQEQQKDVLKIDMVLRYEKEFSFYGNVLSQIRAIKGITIARADEMGVVDVYPDKKQLVLHLKFIPDRAILQYAHYLKNEFKHIRDSNGEKILSVRLVGFPKKVS
jgi:hypothetical protein